MHGVSTLSTIGKLMAPYEGLNILFFAALPMLAAIYVLWIYRDQDVLFTYEKKRPF